jgi:hypothetical protein
MRGLRIIAFSLVCFCFNVANAHDGRPIYLELTQSSADEYELSWRLPPTLGESGAPDIRLEGSCEEVSDFAYAGKRQEKRRYQCRDVNNALKISLSFPLKNPSLSTIVRVEHLGFPAAYLHASPDITLIDIPRNIGELSLFMEYAKLGTEHILCGYDHILFLVCILWLAFTWHRVLLAITGFTIAHSVTLGLSALDIVSFAVAPTEALIALSIVFVAAELVRQDKETLSWRYPVAVSSLFGLLHGLGFASVLQEIGLPTDDALTALLAFNLGVEGGQLIIIGVLISLAWIVFHLSLKKVDLTVPATQKFSGYAVGTLAAFWFIERIDAILFAV